MSDEKNANPAKIADPNQRAVEEAQRDLDRLDSQSEVVGGSAMVRAAKRAGDHLSGADAPENDPVEIWGTRIGRGLGLVFFIGLLIYMVVTYL